MYCTANYSWSIIFGKYDLIRVTIIFTYDFCICIQQANLINLVKRPGCSISVTSALRWLIVRLPESKFTLRQLTRILNIEYSS